MLSDTASVSLSPVLRVLSNRAVSAVETASSCGPSCLPSDPYMLKRQLGLQKLLLDITILCLVQYSIDPTWAFGKKSTNKWDRPRTGGSRAGQSQWRFDMGLIRSSGNFCYIECDMQNCTRKMENVEERLLRRLARLCGWKSRGTQWICPTCSNISRRKPRKASPSESTVVLRYSVGKFSQE